MVVELRTHIQELIYILNGLIYGLYKPDKSIEGRYVSWSKFTSPVRLMHIVLEIRGTSDNEIVHVITAFDED